MEKSRSAAFLNLGCKVNSYETQAMMQSLENAGFSLVDFKEKADVYVINTCTVTAIADKKSRQMIRRAKSNNPDAIVVACGCFVQGEENLNQYGCDIIIGNNNKTKLLDLIEEYRVKNEGIDLKNNILKPGTEYEEMSLSYPESKTRGFLKVQDGCNRYCTYCIVPRVRGISRSRKPEDIIAEAKRYAKSGCSEVVLCAVNLSDYKSEGKNLSDLIKSLDEIDGIKRIRLGSLEPDVFDEEFLNMLSESRKVCPHFHLSLQNGCDETLLKMGRTYTFDSAKKAVEGLKKIYKNPAICADIIAGFPGETDENHRESYNNIRDLGLFELHVFPYSERKGTKAVSMPGIVKKGIRQERAAEYLSLSETLSRDYKNAMANKPCEVLFEEKKEISGKLMWTGFTKEYIRVAVFSKDDLRGKTAKCTMTEPLDDTYYGVSLLSTRHGVLGAT